MAIIDVKVPQLSESVSEATLLTWHKQVGEAVAEGENLIDVETDKVVLELPASKSGVLSKIIKGDGEKVGSEELIAQIDTAAVAAKSVSAANSGRFGGFAIGEKTCARKGGRCRQFARQRTRRARHQGRCAECDAASHPSAITRRQCRIGTGALRRPATARNSAWR